MDNKKIGIIYKSKYGSTEKYANWIAEEVNGELFESSEIEVNELRDYNVIVYGGGIYAVGINGLKFIKKVYSQFKDKKIVIFGVGVSPVRPEVYEEVKEKNLTEEMEKEVDFFLLRGALNYEKLTIFDKFLMNVLKFMINRKDPEELTADEKVILSCIENSVDFTDKNKIFPIVRAIKDYNIK